MDKTTLSFDDLCCHYGTGRSFLISKTGKHKTMGYRQGIMCKLGDIEQSEWMQLVRDLISRSGEDGLYEMLYAWLQEGWRRPYQQHNLEMEALKLHAARLFDDEGWVDFIDFNQRFRPDVLEAARLVLIRCECCKKPGYTTQTLLNRTRAGTTPCPICKRWAAFQIIESTKEVEST